MNVADGSGGRDVVGACETCSLVLPGLSISFSITAPVLAFTEYSYSVVPTQNSISYSKVPSSLSSLTFLKTASDFFTPASLSAISLAFAAVMNAEVCFSVVAAGSVAFDAGSVAVVDGLLSDTV